MIYDKEKLQDIVTEIVNDHIVKNIGNLEDELIDRIGKSDNFGGAVMDVITTCYAEGLINTKKIIVETLYRILNEV